MKQSSYEEAVEGEATIVKEYDGIVFVRGGMARR